MRPLLLLSTTSVAMVLTFSSQERRAYIPPELKRRLCELSGKASTCDFNEVQSTPVDDENYSKWSICKYHPELLPCKWDPLKKITIPIVRYEAESFPSPPNFIKAEPDIFAIDLSQATAIMKPLVEPKEALKAKESLVLRGSKVDNRASYTSRNYGPGGPKEVIPPRYDGKLNVENELKINQRRKPIASPETEEFDENILMANDDVFGG